MKTKLFRSRGAADSYQLLVAEPECTGKLVLATLDHYHHTGAWILCDIRLHPFATPSPYFSASAEDVWSSYTAEDADQAGVIRGLLRDFVERPSPSGDGRIDFEWCPFQGVVAGQRINEITKCPQTYFNESNPPIFHRRKDGLALLDQFASEWAQLNVVEGVDLKVQAKVKVPNAFSQPTESHIMAIVLSDRILSRERERGG